MAKANNGFVPDDYSPLSKGQFMKLADGANNIRILSKPLIGKLYWVSPEGVIRERGRGQKGDKPYRVDYKSELPEGVLDLHVKEFWMMKVWDYADEAVKILEITQASILRPLYEFIEDPKWGDPREYDINIKREGSGMETKYFVMPSPPTALAPEIKDAFEEDDFDLEAFLTTDPFEGMEDLQEEKPTSKKDVDEDDTTDLEEDLPF